MQNISKNSKGLANTINQLELVYIIRTLHLIKAEYIFFSSSLSTYIKTLKDSSEQILF